MANEPVKQPTVTSANVPAQPVAPVIIDDSDIVAKPLVGADFTNLRPSSPNNSLRWVNRSAGGGARFDQMKAMGFRSAVAIDILGEVPKSLLRDGSIINGDLILMVIAKVDYVGQLKLNRERAMKRVSRRNTLETGRRELSDALNGVPGSAANKSKISTYTPNL